VKILPLFGLMLTLLACSSKKEEKFDEFSFTAEEMEEITSRIDDIEQGRMSSASSSLGMEAQITGAETVVLDVNLGARFTALRSGMGPAGENTVRVTNAFLNVRATPSVQGEKIEELKSGALLKLLSFENAAWAQVELDDGRKGYVNVGYIAQMATESSLPTLKKQYEGQYYVDFAFLNVRSSPSSQGQKIGELQSNAIIRPLAIHEEWARITFDPSTPLGAGAKEGFVSSQYLKPFSPAFIVRQEQFALPILRYRGDEGKIGETLVQHLAYLKGAGRTILTLRDFYDLLLKQEEKDIRLPLDAVLLTFSDLTPTSLKEISDALRATGARGTFFIRTDMIGPEGISPGLIQTVVANGNDVQSAGHGGEDLRSLTNAQVTLDLGQSRQILADLTGKEVFAIAYPGGGVNDRVREQALSTGYLFGLTFNASPGGVFNRSQFLDLPSNVISSGTSEQTLKVLLGIVQ
jgi:uncharacterized protein YgiM (DUF1202 family)